jgi:hypothetical protein
MVRSKLGWLTSAHSQESGIDINIARIEELDVAISWCMLVRETKGRYSSPDLSGKQDFDGEERQISVLVTF